MLARKTVEAVDALLSKLRDEEKWTIAPDQVIRTHTVLLELLEDPDIATPADLTPWIAPIVCGSPAEQRDFYERMANLTVVPPPTVRRQQVSTGPAIRTRRNLIVLASTLLLIAFAFIVSVIYMWTPKPSFPLKGQATETTSSIQPAKSVDLAPAPTGVRPGLPVPTTTQPSPSRDQYFATATSGQLATALIGTLALFGAAALVLLRLRRQYELTKAFEREGDVDHHYPQLGTALFMPADFRRIGQLMLRRRYEVSETIDVPRSVRATTRNGGYFTAIYGSRGRLPEYVALIDRATVDDQQALLCEEYVAQLRNVDVPVDVYEFRRDPRICWRKGKRRDNITFTDLARVHGDDALLLFSDAATFTDPMRVELAYWAEPFRKAFRAVAVFTSRPPSHWDEREQLVARENIGIFPASGAGIAAFADTLNAIETVPVEWSDALPSLPPILTYQTSRWVANARPADSLVKQLLRELEVTLGVDGIRWLAASAVYPGINWYVTLYLAAALNIEEVERNLLALVRLPWFRRGTMPDWLRTELIWNMSRKEETDVRAALKHLFVSSMRSKEGVAALHVVTYRDIRNAAPENSPVRDYVLARFMDGYRPRPLDMKLPGIWDSIKKSLSGGEGRRDPMLRLIAAYLPITSVWAAYGMQSDEVRWHGRNGTALTVWAVVWAVAVSIAAVVFVKPFADLDWALLLGAFSYTATFLPLPALALHRARRGERLRLTILAEFADGQKKTQAAVAGLGRRWILRMFYYVGPTGFLFWKSRDPVRRWHARNGSMLFVLAAIIDLFGLAFENPRASYGLLAGYVLTALLGAEFAVRRKYLRLPLISAAVDHVPPESAEDVLAAAARRDRRRLIAIVVTMFAANFLVVSTGADLRLTHVSLATDGFVMAAALGFAVIIDKTQSRRLGMLAGLVTILAASSFAPSTIAAAAMLFFGNAIVVASAFTRGPVPLLAEPANIYAIVQLPRLINVALIGQQLLAQRLTIGAVCICIILGVLLIRIPYRPDERASQENEAVRRLWFGAVSGAAGAVILIAFSVSAYFQSQQGVKPPLPVGMFALVVAIAAFLVIRLFTVRLGIALGIIALSLPVLVGMSTNNTAARYMGNAISCAREIVFFLALSALVSAGVRYRRRFVVSTFVAVQIAGGAAAAWSSTFSLNGAVRMGGVAAAIAAVGAVAFFAAREAEQKTVPVDTQATA